MDKNKFFIGMCILAMIFSINNIVGVDGSSGYPTGWTKCKNITINNPTGSTLNNFPVNINITYDADMQADFDDIRFYSGGCGGTGSALYAELESKTDSVNAYAWVKTNLSAGNNILSMYYENSGASSSWDNGSNVWDSNYVLVLHMNDSHDSSMYANTVVNEGAVSAAGAWGNSMSFNKTERLNVTNSSSLDLTTNMTFTAIVNPRNFPTTYPRIISREATTTAQPYSFTLTNGATLNVCLYVASELCYATTKTISANVWTEVDVTYDNVSVKDYINGLNNKTNTKTGALAEYDYNVLIGNNPSLNRYYNGSIDEVRISKITRSASWINLTYLLLINHSSFVTYGTEESGVTSYIYYSQNSTNSTVAAANTKFSLYWNSSLGLSSYIFSWCNGTYTNTTSTQINPVLLMSGFENAVTDNFTTNNWVQASDQKKSGSNSAKLNDGNPSYLTSNAVNTTACTNISIKFESYNDDMDASGDAVMYYKNSSGNWNLIYDIGADNNDDAFYPYNFTTTDTQYLYNGFQINLSSTSLTTASENWWIDDVNISCQSTTVTTTQDNCSNDGAIMTNDSATSFSGTLNWSNITKTIANLQEYTIKWCVYANDTSGNINSSSCTNPFSFVITAGEAPTNTCSCPIIPSDWFVNLAHHCNITSPCNITGYQLILVNGTIGDYINVSSTITCKYLNISNAPSGTKMIGNGSGYIKTGI